MKTLKTALLTLAMAGTPALAQDCTAPAAPTLPDGGSSSYEEMVAGMGSVKDYQAANAEYLSSCLEPAIEAAKDAMAEDASDEAKAALVAAEKAYNDAVSAEEDLAGQFNTEIREYKAANPE